MNTILKGESHMRLHSILTDVRNKRGMIIEFTVIIIIFTLQLAFNENVDKKRTIV